MKYEIGQVVIFKENLDNRYLVLATKTQNLNDEYLNLKNGNFKIKDINKIAKTNLSVTLGSHYKIGEIIGNENGNSIIGKLVSAFEDDLQI